MRLKCKGVVQYLFLEFCFTYYYVIYFLFLYLSCIFCCCDFISNNFIRFHRLSLKDNVISSKFTFGTVCIHPSCRHASVSLGVTDVSPEEYW